MGKIFYVRPRPSINQKFHPNVILCCHCTFEYLCKMYTFAGERFRHGVISVSYFLSSEWGPRFFVITHLPVKGFSRLSCLVNWSRFLSVPYLVVNRHPRIDHLPSGEVCGPCTTHPFLPKQASQRLEDTDKPLHAPLYESLYVNISIMLFLQFSSSHTL